jgi:hypothetical protein
MKKEPEGPPVASRRNVRSPLVPRAQLPRAVFHTRWRVRIAGGPVASRRPIRLRRPPTSPSGLAAVRRSRWTSLSLAAFRWSRVTDSRWSVSRRPGGSLCPASRPSSASEAPFRLSDLSASLPVRCLRAPGSFGWRCRPPSGPLAPRPVSPSGHLDRSERCGMYRRPLGRSTRRSRRSQPYLQVMSSGQRVTKRRRPGERDAERGQAA